MSDFMFKPEAPVAKIKGREKEYVCGICGKTRLAKEMSYAGRFIDTYRDPDKFVCSEHMQ